MKYLSLCGIVKNEALYIKEWVEFHLNQGFEHFYLYDNESEDGTKEAVKELSKYITWHDVKGFKQQRVAYNHMISDHRNETEWCAFIDCDEFLFSFRDPTFVQTFKNLYASELISGLAVHWLLFGSGRQREYRPEPVIKRFTWRACTVNEHVKSIMKLSETTSMGLDPHSFRATGPIIDEKFNMLSLNYAITSPATADVIAINHYHNKSYEEYIQRRKLPDANSGEFKDPDEQFWAHETNDIEDLRIQSRS